MTAPRPKLPKLRRQKEKTRHDRAFVVLDGQKIPCGRWGTPDAQRKYDRAVAEWLSNNRRRPVKSDQQVTVAVVVDRFNAHAGRHYVHRDGTPTSKQAEYRQVFKPLLTLYADLPAEDFDTLCLKAVRQRMLDAGWARTTINHRVRLLRHVFKWASSEKLVDTTVHQALRDVMPLDAHRSDARETEPIGPVDDAVVEVTMAHLTPTLQAMIEVQRLTGMRPSEVCSMTTGAIDTSGDVWVYRVKGHKTEHTGRERLVFIGPKAQQELRPWLKTDLSAPVFSPQQSERERLEALRAQRKTPMSCGNGPGDNRVDQRRRAPAARWTTQSYGRAIQRACDEAFPPPEDLAYSASPAPSRPVLSGVGIMTLNYPCKAFPRPAFSTDFSILVECLNRVIRDLEDYETVDYCTMMLIDYWAEGGPEVYGTIGELHGAKAAIENNKHFQMLIGYVSGLAADFPDDPLILEVSAALSVVYRNIEDKHHIAAMPYYDDGDEEPAIEIVREGFRAAFEKCGHTLETLYGKLIARGELGKGSRGKVEHSNDHVVNWTRPAFPTEVAELLSVDKRVLMTDTAIAHEQVGTNGRKYRFDFDAIEKRNPDAAEKLNPDTSI